jgi:hypothetical protein
MVAVLLLSLGWLFPSDPTRQQQSPRSATAPVTLTLRIAGGQIRFHTGEIIPIELVFTSQSPNRFVLDSATYDRSGRLTLDEFHVEPIDRVSDPLLDYFAAAAGFIGGGIRGMPVLNDQPTIVKLELNEWFRFDHPGTYRLSVRSRRVTDDAGAGKASRQPLVIDSNVVTFEIVPGDPDWASATLASALRILNSTGAHAEPREGCRMLRFLATDAAVDEMIARFDDARWGCGFDYIAGLFSAPNRERVVSEMESALERPEQSVSSSFLRTLALLAIYVAYPEYRPSQTSDTKGRFPPPGEVARNQQLIDTEIAKYRAIVLASVSEKARPARALTLADPFSAQKAPDDTLRRQLAGAFLDLPAERQWNLLEYSWGRLASPDMLPALRTLVAHGPAANQPFGDVALLRLCQLAPDEGRPLLLNEIAAPPPGATLRTLGSLPDRELPLLDDRLASNVESLRGDLSLHAELLQRYGTEAVATRVLAAVQDRLAGLACQSKAALLGYFVRVDPGLGARLVADALAARRETGCYTSVLLDTAKLHMAPELESAAVAHLTDSESEVVANAVEMLGRYGSPAAEPPLRAAFERWHAAWQDRADEVQPRLTQPHVQLPQSMVEYRFVEALAQAGGWVADKTTVDALRALCVTDSCRTTVNRMVDQIDRGEIDTFVLDRDDVRGTIAQYDVESLAQLERKLAQYSAGTRFRLRVRAPTPEIEASIRERIVRAARGRGIEIE